jgi:hypothetical protein
VLLETFKFLGLKQILSFLLDNHARHQLKVDGDTIKYLQLVSRYKSIRSLFIIRFLTKIKSLLK